MPNHRTIFVLHQHPDTCREVAEILAQHNISVLFFPPNFFLSPCIFLQDDQRDYLFKFKHILCINASGSQVELHTTKDNTYPDKILFSKTLGDMQAMLPAECFMRIHDKWLVNIEHVMFRCKKDMTLRLADGSELPVSDRYRPKVKETFRQLSCCTY